MAAGAVVVVALGGVTFWSVRRDAGRRRSAEDWHRRLRRELIDQSAFLDGARGAASARCPPRSTRPRCWSGPPTRPTGCSRRTRRCCSCRRRTGDGLRPAAARGIALGPIADIVVETNASARFAPVADRGGDDALSARLRPTARLTVPIMAADELRGLLVLMRLRAEEPFGPAELTQASVLADFAATASTNAHLFARVESLLAQARMRETERAELSRRVVSAEQDERRKLSLVLDDGRLRRCRGSRRRSTRWRRRPLPARIESALRAETARERQRGRVVRSMRELSFASSRGVLRVAASSQRWVRRSDQVQRSYDVEIEARRRAGGGAPPTIRSSSYQIVARGCPERVKHAAPTTVAVVVTGGPEAATTCRCATTAPASSGGPEDGLPHDGLASMRERAQILGAKLKVESVPGAGRRSSCTWPADERCWRRRPDAFEAGPGRPGRGLRGRASTSPASSTPPAGRRLRPRAEPKVWPT